MHESQLRQPVCCYIAVHFLCGEMSHLFHSYTACEAGELGRVEAAAERVSAGWVVPILMCVPISHCLGPALLSRSLFFWLFLQFSAISIANIGIWCSLSLSLSPLAPTLLKAFAIKH